MNNVSLINGHTEGEKDFTKPNVLPKEAFEELKALEKQIPQKPLIQYDDIGRSYRCPKCQGLILTKNAKYCAECGQALERRDSE